MASDAPAESPLKQQAKSKLWVPAMILMVLAPVSIPLAGLDFAGRMFAKPEYIPLVDQNDPQAVEQAMMVSNVFAVVDILHIVLQFIVFVGALMMVQVKAKPLAMAAAFIACIPCLSPICCLGVPAGIWSLVAMNDPLVQRAFDA